MDTYTAVQYSALADAVSGYRCVAFLLSAGLVVAGFFIYYKIRVLTARYQALASQVGRVESVPVVAAALALLPEVSSAGGADEDSSVSVSDVTEGEAVAEIVVEGPRADSYTLFISKANAPGDAWIL